jgi:hypothetical protein
MAEVEFDFHDVVPTVQYFDRRANQDDAEEAVQTAVVKLLESNLPLIPSYVVTKAQTRLHDAVARHERRALSLDRLLTPTDQGGDGYPESRLRRIVEAGQSYWTYGTIIYALQRWMKVHGRPPTARECRQDPWLPAMGMIQRKVGNLREAISEAESKMKEK